MKSLTIAVNAQIYPDGSSGGVQQFVTALLYALGQLDGPEKYLVVGPPDKPDWLEPYLGKNQQLVRVDDFYGQRRPFRYRLRGVTRRALRSRRGARTRLISATVRHSDGLWEALGAQVVHFPYQRYQHCRIPAIFNPHDLQHLHYPEFFTREVYAERELAYPFACRDARFVIAESRWVRDDIVLQYGIEPEKVATIYRGSPLEAYEPMTDDVLRAVQTKFSLPDQFALYPAQTWLHKNHLLLFDAVKRLRDDGVCIQLVCTGRKSEFWPTLERKLLEDGLGDQISFPGFVKAVELRALYRLAQFLVFPSLFEGGGFPIVEAFGEGTPVACSTATSLPEYAGDAALFFDPTSSESIAQALRRMSGDPELRTTLRDRGFRRIGFFSWDRTARTYRAVYRKAAGYDLSEDELELLATGGLPQKALQLPTSEAVP